MRNIYSRPHVIYQEQASSELSMLVLKQKYCNEGEISLNFMAQDDGSVGVVF